MSSRPSLASLSERLAKKDNQPSPEPSLAESTKPSSKDERVQVLVRMLPSERKALRRIALDSDTTVQALVEDAIRDLLRRYGISSPS